MRAALDTNVILYAEGVNDGTRQVLANWFIAQLRPQNICLPVQALAEATSKLSRIASIGKELATARVSLWTARFSTQATTPEVFQLALQICNQHKFQIFDSIILAAANAAGATVLLSEDMHEGFIFNGTIIANPFKENPSRQLELLLAQNLH